MNRVSVVSPIVLVLAACSSTPTAPVALPQPAAPIMGAPTPLIHVPTATLDPNVLSKVKSELKSLGYSIGKANEPADLAFQRAVKAFQKDQGIAEDGLLTAALIDKIHAARVSMPVASAPKAAIYIYAERGGAGPITLSTPIEGFSSDAPPNLLMPFRLGRTATFTITGKRMASEKITCRVGKPTTEEGLLASDTVAVDCDGDGKSSWHDLFSPRLGAVIKRQVGERAQVLVAVRPATTNWPNAARTGLDWAITSALEAPQGSAPVKWSSTAVAVRFDIRASKVAHISGLRRVKPNAPVSCRRFELVQGGTNASFPAFACQEKDGAWSIAGTRERISRPNIIQDARR